MGNKEHWENIYATKQPNEVSWTQEVPQTSLKFIEALNLPKTSSIIDIGGGDSTLVDHLIELGYSNITVLDISKNAIERAKKRLGEKANTITFIVSDIIEFKPETSYDIWHDRAVFHFLTTSNDIKKYVDLVNMKVNSNMIIGTFSDDGPLKCSGLEISQYNKVSMPMLFSENFNVKSTLIEDHTTPFNTTQNFIYCSFSKK